MTADHDNPRPEADDYESPAITPLGTVAEVTLGHSGNASDGTFTGSIL